MMMIFLLMSRKIIKGVIKMLFLNSRNNIILGAVYMIPGKNDETCIELFEESLVKVDLHLKLPEENPRDGATSARLEKRRFSALFINS